LDTILVLKSNGEELKIEKTSQVTDFISSHKGQNVEIVLQRWGKTFNLSATPNATSLSGGGYLGIGLARVALVSVKWYEAPYRGIVGTGNLTIATVQAFGGVLGHIVEKKEVPAGVTLMGPLGIFNFLKQVSQLGINYFLYFLALVSILMAISNLLPIPALDGGKLLFLIIEAVRRKPISPKIEQNITTTFFLLLIIFSIFVTIKFDIPRIF
jgi:regulator of sigma E protease